MGGEAIAVEEEKDTVPDSRSKKRRDHNEQPEKLHYYLFHNFTPPASSFFFRKRTETKLIACISDQTLGEKKNDPIFCNFVLLVFSCFLSFFFYRLMWN